MERNRQFRILTLALAPFLLLAGGCRSSRDSAPATPEPPRQAAACVPIEVDGATADLWSEALASFVDRRQVRQGCVLVPQGDCLLDAPASVLDRLRRRAPVTQAWSFQCGAGVTVMTLKDEQAGRRTITIGDGFAVSCRWTTRRTWLPTQGRLKSEGCEAITRK